MLDAAVIVITTACILGGIIGSVAPVIPGPVLVFAGAVLYAWHTGFTEVTWGVIVLLAVLAGVAQVLDYAASVLGAQRFGASRWGIIGACIGGIAGLVFGGFAGILLGPLIGAVLLELLSGRRLGASLKIGTGTVIGLLGGTLGRVVVAFVMAGIFAAALWL